MLIANDMLGVSLAERDSSEMIETWTADTLYLGNVFLWDGILIMLDLNALCLAILSCNETENQCYLG